MTTSPIAARCSTCEVSISLDAGPVARAEARAAFSSMAGHIDGLVVEHATAVIDELLRERAELGPDQDGTMELEAWKTPELLRVLVSFAPGATRPESPEAFHAALGRIEQLADRWGFAYDGRLSLWFEMDAGAPSGASHQA